MILVLKCVQNLYKTLVGALTRACTLCMYLHFPTSKKNSCTCMKEKSHSRPHLREEGLLLTFKETEQICAVTAGDVSSHVQVEGSSQKLVEASKGLGQNAESKPHRTMLLDGARGVWM